MDLDINVNANEEYTFEDEYEQLKHYLASTELTTSKKNRALINAIKYNSDTKQKIAFCQLLLDYGADINGVSYGDTPIFVALFHNNDIAIVEFLINNGANVKFISDNGWTPLHIVCGDGNTENSVAIAKLLLDHGASIHLNEKIGGETPLTFAVHVGYVDMIRFLLENGADPNLKNDDDETPLVIVTNSHERENKLEILNLLLKHGADPDSSMLDYFIRLRHIDGVQLLLEYVSITNDLLYTAAARSNPEIVNLLLTEGKHVDINGSTSGGGTALHGAMCNRNTIPIIKMLLDHGAHVNAKNNKEQTPLDIAILFEDTDCQELLLQYGAISTGLIDKEDPDVPPIIKKLFGEI